MAKLSPETLTRIFNLLRQIAEEIEIAGEIILDAIEETSI